MMKITGLSHLFKWENLHNWWLTKYFFAPLYVCILTLGVRFMPVLSCKDFCRNLEFGATYLIFLRSWSLLFFHIFIFNKLSN